MAHTEEMMINGVITDVTVFDSPAQDIDDAAVKAKYLTNPNLLDNAYWASPDAIIDQRQGYVVPPGTNYWVAGTSEIYQLSSYQKVIGYYEGGFPKIAIDGIEYATPSGSAVRGYTGAGYGIDRWILQSFTSCSMLIGDGYITLYAKYNDGLLQKISADQLSDGDTITVSVLTDTELLSKTITLTETVQVYPYDNSVWNIAAGKSNGIWFVWALITYNQSTEQAINIKAAKLELGTVQTLAHQDKNGNWVLNEIPDYGEQLARCQRYLVDLNPYRQSVPIIGSAHIDSGHMWVSIPLPTSMRTIPAITGTNGSIFVSDGTGSSEITVQNDIRMSAGMITISAYSAVNRSGIAYLLSGGGLAVPAALLSAEL